ncbi:MAG: polyribonucleotide nucleotidyltransferase [Chloroflexi bacterium]|nr:polyribonucleotide nucleotidyltransferase [Chloroflexota bacterium]
MVTAHTVHREVGGRELTIETGLLARQANASVTVRYGDTLVLVTATASPQPREGVDFLPLTVDYEERLYAAGKIPGSFFRREGRPSQEAILAGRLTDRTIRPLFPKGFRHEVQVIITVLSVDKEIPPDVLGTIGASAALSLSDISFEGPVSSTRIGYVDGAFVINPTFSQVEQGSLDLIVAGSRDAVVMVEAGAKEVDESLLLEAIRLGQEVNRRVIQLQEDLAAQAGKPKMAFVPAAKRSGVEEAVRAALRGRLSEVVRQPTKGERSEALDTLQEELREELEKTYASEEWLPAFEEQVKAEVRDGILTRGRRPDGRGPKEIRPISCAVGILPRTHGTGLFTRGETQVLSIVTLGSIAEVQKLDTLSPEETRRFLHHYNFPPFSTGEVKRIGSPGRREIGHGALAERALEPVVPSQEEFPYTLRIVSEVLSSNGSTSMASVCGSCLALMDAGVPIKRPVAGVAMGLVTGEGGRFAVLTDIQGVEDAMGDMDFKVAGTTEGVTALQMDIKLKGISHGVLEAALAQAREARLYILDKMLEAIPGVRETMSPFAPRMTRLHINPERIGALIGPGGKTIRSITEQTKATINVENDGTVYVGSTSAEAAERAIEMIRRLTQDITVGEVYTGKVVRIMPFGAFVEIAPGRDGMVHISELADYRVGAVEDICKLGDEMTVLVTEIDPAGKIRLSRRAVLEKLQGSGGDGQETGGEPSRPPAPREEQPSRPGGPRPLGDRGPRRDDRRGPPRGPFSGRGHGDRGGQGPSRPT